MARIGENPSFSHHPFLRDELEIVVVSMRGPAPEDCLLSAPGRSRLSGSSGPSDFDGCCARGAVVRLEQFLAAGRLERVDDALDVLGVLGSGDQEGVGSIDDDGARHP